MSRTPLFGWLRRMAAVAQAAREQQHLALPAAPFTAGVEVQDAERGG